MSKTLESLSYLYKALIHGVVYEDSTSLFKTMNFHGTLQGSPSITNHEFELYLDSNYDYPFRTVRRLNEIVASIPLTPRSRITLLSEVLNLEILTDDLLFPETGDFVHNGIPHYLRDGYTDLGSFEDGSAYGRKGRAKFRFRKNELRTLLLLSKKNASELGDSLYTIEGTQKLFSSMNYYLGLTFDYDGREVCEREREQDGSVVLNFYSDDNGKYHFICRHIAVVAQMMLQTTGVISRLKKGNFLNSRHAWNIYRVGKEGYLVDFTNGFGIEELSLITDTISQQIYVETDDQRNHYKIKRTENKPILALKPKINLKLRRKLKPTTRRSTRQLKRRLRSRRQ